MTFSRFVSVVVLVVFCQCGIASAQSNYISFQGFNAFVNGMPGFSYAVGDDIESKTNVKLNNNTGNTLYYTVEKSRSHNGTVYQSVTTTFSISAYAYVDENCTMSKNSADSETYVFQVKVTVKDAAGDTVGSGVDSHIYSTGGGL